ncbi:MAG: hypothetical protein ACR2FN_04175 [Chitinophagaceae bacterium]
MKLKKIIFLIFIIYGNISSIFGQNNTAIYSTVCKNKILQLNNTLLSTDLERATSVKVNKITYKFYDTIIYTFFDTAEMKSEMTKDTSFFSVEGKIDVLRNVLFIYHCWLTLNKSGSFFYSIIRTDWQCKPIPTDYNETKNAIGLFHTSPCAPDFYFRFNPKNNELIAVDMSSSAFEGKEQELKSLLTKLNIKTPL